MLACEKSGDIESSPLDPYPSESDENGATIPLLQLIQQLLRYNQYRERTVNVKVMSTKELDEILLVLQNLCFMNNYMKLWSIVMLVYVLQCRKVVQKIYIL